MYLFLLETGMTHSKMKNVASSQLVTKLHGCSARHPLTLRSAKSSHTFYQWVQLTPVNIWGTFLQLDYLCYCIDNIELFHLYQPFYELCFCFIFPFLGSGSFILFGFLISLYTGQLSFLMVKFVTIVIKLVYFQAVLVSYLLLLLLYLGVDGGLISKCFYYWN